MRKIDTRDVRLATRTTPRDLNRQIVLNLIREHQPISRAELARRLGTGRGAVTTLVAELLADDLVYDGATGPTTGGRRPTYLYLRTEHRLAAAVDVRSSRTYVMLGDFGGRPLAFEAAPTERDPERFADAVAARVGALVAAHADAGRCEGLGVVVPGMVDRRSGRVLRAPQLGWRDVALHEALARRTHLPVWVENAPIACALAHMWLPGAGDPADRSFVYVSVSDGVGAGVVTDGQLLRGQTQTAGEFGHLPLTLDGPRCSCGALGCWEAYTSNPATLARYAARRAAPPDPGLTVDELVRRAERGEDDAVATLRETGRYLGLGLSGIVNAVNPGRIYVGGEITAAWPLIDDAVHLALGSRALTPEAAATPVLPDRAAHPRLRGALALVAAPTYAAPRLG